MSDSFDVGDTQIRPVSIVRMRIEPAQPSDVPAIRDLIQELADFERLSDQVVATHERLRATLFGPKPSAEVLMARLGDETVGFALFFHNYSTFRAQPGLYLEDLYVRPAHRGKGYGEELLRELARLAVQRECGRFEWSVLDWNQRAIDFYKALGAEPLNEWTMFRVSGDNLTKLAQR
ncbi:MAG TPA: GNAT family N-acetyltransferase [Steroidobacteraceae bacterium]|nr:GNAT family N-acetyltransferase [Steroidobacteraceae bacterium]